MAQTTVNRSMAGLAPVKPSTIRRTKGLDMAILGPQSGGKTSLLYTLTENPEYLPLAVFDFNGGAHVLKDHEDIDIYQVDSWAQAEKIEQQLSNGDMQYNSVAFDILTEMQLLAQEHCGVFKTDNPQLRMNKYGEANAKTLSLTRSLHTLTNDGLNVFYLVWAMEDRDGDIVKLTMDLSPTFRRQFTGVVDFCVYVEQSPPPNPYPPTMRTGGSNKYATRTRVSPDSPLLQLPNVIYQPSLASILDCFHGAPWDSARHNERLDA